ncbi:MAG: ferritin-like domain-containing protein [Planctomycetes bacterium]|nr:ferritin-like domain-containing protein [Planctomycetota bacterium]
MNHPTPADLLNELLLAEQQNAAHQAIQASVFISGLSARDAVLVRRMAEESRAHCAWLTEQILRLGGSPAPRAPTPQAAEMNFQELGYVRPRLIRSHEALIATYARAAEQLGGDPLAARVVAQIQARHRATLEALQGLGAAPAARAG